MDPPEALSVALYALPTVPPDNCEFVTCKGGMEAFTVRTAALLVTLPAELLTITVNCAPLSEVLVAGVV